MDTPADNPQDATAKIPGGTLVERVGKEEEVKTMAKKDARPWAVRNRVGVLRATFGGLAVVLILSRRGWTDAALFEEALETGGIFLVVIGTFIRLYSAVFIYGRKTTSLVTVGPYSVVRNPLYLGSFVAAAGVALLSGSFIVLGGVMVLFLSYYPTAVGNEELRLRSLHRDKFEKYARQTPRVIPRFSLFREPDYAVVNTRKLKWAYLEGLGFIGVALALSLVETLQVSGMIQPYFRLP